jgi:hypothetical protein
MATPPAIFPDTASLRQSPYVVVRIHLPFTGYGLMLLIVVACQRDGTSGLP